MKQKLYITVWGYPMPNKKFSTDIFLRYIAYLRHIPRRCCWNMCCLGRWYQNIPLWQHLRNVDGRLSKLSRMQVSIEMKRLNAEVPDITRLKSEKKSDRCKYANVLPDEWSHGKSIKQNSSQTNNEIAIFSGLVDPVIRKQFEPSQRVKTMTYPSLLQFQDKTSGTVRDISPAKKSRFHLNDLWTTWLISSKFVLVATVVLL